MSLHPFQFHMAVLVYFLDLVCICDFLNHYWLGFRKKEKFFIISEVKINN